LVSPRLRSIRICSLVFDVEHLPASRFSHSLARNDHAKASTTHHFFIPLLETIVPLFSKKWLLLHRLSLHVRGCLFCLSPVGSQPSLFWDDGMNELAYATLHTFYPRTGLVDTGDFWQLLAFVDHLFQRYWWIDKYDGILTQCATDRTLKTIGIVDAYPKYSDLTGFEK